MVGGHSGATGRYLSLLPSRLNFGSESVWIMEQA